MYTLRVLSPCHFDAQGSVWTVKRGSLVNCVLFYFKSGALHTESGVNCTLAIKMGDSDATGEMDEY